MDGFSESASCIMNSLSYPIHKDLTGTLASFLAKTNYQLLSLHTRSNIKSFFLDYIAAVHAGYRVNKAVNDAIFQIVFAETIDCGSHVFFSKNRTQPLNAAFLNAFYAHGADMDDGNKLAAGHIGAHVMSSLMALAEERNFTFGEFFSSIVVGYEVFCRLSSACMPYMVDRGFHSTGTAGALASAAACARLLNLDVKGMQNAISLSATQASGLLLAGETRQDMKSVNPANAARVGLLSALLAEKGIKGPLKPLESDKGWLHAMTPTANIDRILGNLGEKYCIDESYLKPYPSCRHTHCVIQAAVSLSKKIVLKDIKSIEIITYNHAIELAGKIDFPSTIGEAKFSLKYASAIALTKGRFSIEDLDPGLADDFVRGLIGKITLVRDDSYERPEEGIRGACLIVKTSDDKAFQEEVLIPKGDPENPFTKDDIKAKLRSCFSDWDGNSDPTRADNFLDWYYPIISNPENIFVFPQKGDE